MDGEAVPGPSVDAAEVADVPGAPASAIVWHLFMLAAGAGGMWLFLHRGWYRLDQSPAEVAAPTRQCAFSAPIGGALFVAAIVLAQIGAQIAMFGLNIDPQQPNALREIALVGLGGYVAQTLVLIVFGVLLLRAAKPQPDRRPSIVRSALLGAGALLLVWPVVISLSWIASLLVRLVTGSMPGNVAHSTLVMLLESERSVWFAVVVLMAVVLAPIFEEVLYRGILQRSLDQIGLSRWTAIAMTSAVFAVMHVAASPARDSLPGMLVALFVLSLGFGWVYEKTGRLAAPIVMHSLFNAANLAAAMVMSQPV